MGKLTIVANIKVKAGQEEQVQTELLKLVEQTRAKDEGCISYDLHRDNENPAHFLVFENWQSKEMLQKHIESEHFKHCMAVTDGAFEEFVVNEMTQVG